MTGFENIIPEETILETYFDRLWPICRSITGSGFRDSLKILSEICPFETLEVKSGTKVLDWTVPKEWNIQDAWIENSSGERIVDFKKSNLHVVSYSTPVDEWMDLEQLQNHLHSLPDQPNAIPYLTSYYRERWGFCITHDQRLKLKPGKYRAVIQSTLKEGILTVGHFLLPSTEGSKDEILISSYLCHPSLANNELSGPVVAIFLYQILSRLTKRKYNYRFVIGPETIGSIFYLSQYGDHLKEHCIAGYVVTCCGDDRMITYKRSRSSDSIADRIALNAIEYHAKKLNKPYRVEKFAPHDGSDDRQYCSPGFNLPVGAIMRSMYGQYPEYHTSLDNKSIISFSAMRETLEIYLKTFLSLEANRTYVNQVMKGEPMLGPRGLYPTLGSSKHIEEKVKNMLWLINYSDGEHDLCDIANRAGCSVLELSDIANELVEKGVLKPTLNG